MSTRVNRNKGWNTFSTWIFYADIKKTNDILNDWCYDIYVLHKEKYN